MVGWKKAGEAWEAVAHKPSHKKHYIDLEQVEGPSPSKFGEHELDNLGNKKEVEESLEEGPSSGAKFPEVPKNLAKKNMELSFCIKMLEYMDFVKHELKRGKQEKACQGKLIECLII
jgi:hypothetical protein